MGEGRMWLKQSLMVALTLLLFMGMSSCKSEQPNGPLFQMAALSTRNQGHIYVYRPISDMPARFAHNLYMNGNMLDRLAHGSYVYHPANPGKYRLSLDDYDDYIELNVIAGQTYFVKWTMRYVPGWKGLMSYHPYLVVVDELQALPEIERCRLMR